MQGKYESIKKDDTYFLGAYTAVDDKKVEKLDAAVEEEVKAVVETAKQGALAKVTMFPAFMLLCYIALIVFFNSKGGYKPVDANAAAH